MCSLPSRTALRQALTAATLVLAALGAPPLGADDLSGDAQAGAVIYERCLACHAPERNRTGPRHCGLFGRAAGALPDFPYSEALRQSGLVWNEAALDRFLADPMGTVPGTTMGYAGVEDPIERRDLIAYLKDLDRPGGLCGK